MELINLSYNDYKKNSEPIVATIGQFDGLHIAHLTLIKKTLDISKEKNIKSAIITFDPHPDFVLKKDNSNTYVTPLDEKISLLEKIGIDYMFIVKFDLLIANLEPIDFINKILIDNNVTDVIVGFDFSFGKFGKGKAKDISSLSNNLIKTIIIDEMRYNEEKIGTTLIKKLLKEGHVKEVYKILGRYYKLSGRVTNGKKIGRTLNLPTANLKVNEEFANIKPGVYVVRIKIKEDFYFGFANLGHNPSFNESKNMIFETHIFDFNDDLYSKEIEVELLDFIREEIKFASKEDFLKQIQKDKEFAKNFINNFC